MNGSIVIREDYGLLQVFFRQFQAVHLEIDPAEAVEIRAIRRVGFDRLLRQCSGFFQLQTAIRQNEPKIVLNRGVVVVDLERFAELLFGFAKLFLFFVQRALEEINSLVPGKRRLAMFSTF